VLLLNFQIHKTVYFMTVVTRFAPSPTGYLHIGNIRAALVAWLYARKNNGKFILRIDDTDLERSEERFIDGIKEDLEWLGLHYDQEVRQSQRTALYEAAKEKLIASGRLYPCYETQDELALRKKVMLSRRLAPIYDRGALKLSAEEKQALKDSGRKQHWRFLLKDEEIQWDDRIKGHITFDGAKISDPVLFREDGTMTYSLASVVDDIDLQITDIIRGEDHVSNSAIHIQMFDALGARPPHFGHLSLFRGKNAEISKRTGGFAIRDMRAQGITPLAILSFLSTIGTSSAMEIKSSMQQITDEFDLTKFSRAPVMYDESEIDRLNLKILHNMPYSEALNTLHTMKLDHIVDENFWNTIKSNIEDWRSVEDWCKICRQPLTPKMLDDELTHMAAKLLPTGEWDEHTWDALIAALKNETSKSGKALFMPLRLALTGMEHGPELRKILPLIGRDKSYQRLMGNTA
jgi:glutamyl-tRNA synthetase